MDHNAHSDAELLQRAANGEQQAFAVLVHRQSPAVRASVAADRDPAGATIATFVAAMRGLRREVPQMPARAWLLALAQKQSRRADPARADDPPPIDEDELDEIWAEVDLRWPNGRVPRSVPRWVGWLALVVVLLSLAVLVPYLVLTAGTDDNDVSAVREELVARPYNEPVEREHAEELFSPDEDADEDPASTEPDMPQLQVPDEDADTGPTSSGPTDAQNAPDTPDAPQNAPDPSPSPQTPQAPDPPAPETDDPGPSVDDDPGNEPDSPETPPETQAPPVTEAPAPPDAGPEDPGDAPPADDDGDATPPADEPGAGGGTIGSG